VATSTWLTVLVAAVGLVGTVGGTVAGVVLTQRQASRRDAIAWERERTRERERWAREDADRTFSHRRDAYVDFYESLRDMAFAIYSFGMGLAGEPDENDGRLPPDFQLLTFRKLQHLRIYATPVSAEAADNAYSAAWRWGQDTRFSQDDEQFYESQFHFDEAEEQLRNAIRSDLGIPETVGSWEATVLADPTGNVIDEL
jgi:hypothetical protein